MRLLSSMFFLQLTICTAVVAQQGWPLTANDYVRSGNHHLNKGEYDKAIADYILAVRELVKLETPKPNP